MKYLFSKSARSLQLNSLWLLVARLSAQGSAVIFSILIARRLSAENFGQFTFVSTLLFIGNVFTTFGTDTLLIREIAKAGNLTSQVRSAFTLQLVLSTLWCLAVISLRVDPPILIYSLSLFPLAIFSIVSSLLRAFERMDLFWGLSVFNGVIQIAGAFIASDLMTLCITLLFGNFIVACLALWICFASLPGFSLLPLIDFRPLLRLALPFATLTTFSILSQRLGVLAVFHFTNAVTTALFASSARIVDGLKLGHYVVLGVLLPVLSRNENHAKQAYHITFWILLSLSIFIAGVIGFLAGPILGLLFGAQYIEASLLLKILVWCLVPYTISAFISVDLVIRNEEIKLLKITVFSLVAGIILFTWLIGKYSMVGAVSAALLNETVQALILLYSVRKNINVTKIPEHSNSGITHDI